MLLRLPSPGATPVSGRVFVVDDDRSMCEMVHADLASRGLDGAWRTSADEAFASIRDGDFDVVLTDLKMPNQTGLQLYRAIQLDTRLRQTPVIFITAMTDVLLEYNGTLDKYEGDAIVAFFGAPIHFEDHAQRALEVSLRMQDVLGDLRDKWASEDDKWPDMVQLMRMRIGINAGEINRHHRQWN